MSSAMTGGIPITRKIDGYNFILQSVHLDLIKKRDAEIEELEKHNTEMASTIECSTDIENLIKASEEIEKLELRLRHREDYQLKDKYKELGKAHVELVWKLESLRAKLKVATGALEEFVVDDCGINLRKKAQSELVEILESNSLKAEVALTEIIIE